MTIWIENNHSKVLNCYPDIILYFDKNDCIGPLICTCHSIKSLSFILNCPFHNGFLHMEGDRNGDEGDDLSPLLSPPSDRMLERRSHFSNEMCRQACTRTVRQEHRGRASNVEVQCLIWGRIAEFYIWLMNYERSCARACFHWVWIIMVCYRHLSPSWDFIERIRIVWGIVILNVMDTNALAVFKLLVVGILGEYFSVLLYRLLVVDWIVF